MQSEFRKQPARSRTGLLFGTGFALMLGFVLIVVLYFILSAYTSALLGKCVAVVDINMPLSVEGASPSVFGSGGYPGSEELANTIEGLNKREDVGAVVFVFNSPGGSVVATREVYQSVKDLNKPKVSYFREVAASGAYYIASGTDYIISDPDAITGSIGVIATYTNMAGLLEKVGINVTSITSGPHKDIGSPYRNMTAEETTILHGLIDEIYQEFRGVVLENRGSRLNLALFDNVTDGRILSGRQAYRVGLVDELGDKDDAIMKAAGLANISASSIDDVRVCPVQTTTPSGGLFSVESILHEIQASSSVPSIGYK